MNIDSILPGHAVGADSKRTLFIWFSLLHFLQLVSALIVIPIGNPISLAVFLLWFDRNLAPAFLQLPQQSVGVLGPGLDVFAPLLHRLAHTIQDGTRGNLKLGSTAPAGHQLFEGAVPVLC